MTDIAWELMKLWVLWYSSAAAFGAFIGASVALWIHRVIQRRRARRG